MFKKMFALASVTALTGLVATLSAAGCSSTTTVQPDGDAGGGVDATKKETGVGMPPEGDADTSETGTGTPEEKTVGKECTSSADCKIAGSVNDNQCSKGGFLDGDLFGSPICIQPMCTQGNSNPPTVGDLLCDDQTGLCLPTGGSDTSGICFPFCSFDSTKVVDVCAGGNKCNIAYLGTDTTTKAASAIGFCFGACTADTDCKGTAGQKCQTEDGLCLNADKLVAYAKTVGQGCAKPALATDPAQCNCTFVGNHADGGVSVDADKGFCTHSCITGAGGDAVCNTAKATWKCTAKLPTVDGSGAVAFTAQPTDVSGVCAQPCAADADCSTLNTAVGGTGTVVKCKTFADGKYCDATAD
jgi:hypothetical protein